MPPTSFPPKLTLGSSYRTTFAPGQWSVSSCLVFSMFFEITASVFGGNISFALPKDSSLDWITENYSKLYLIRRKVMPL
jgi:hypothetical protein